LDELTVAIRVGAVLDELGIDYALGGGLASSLQGEPRSTNDIDLAIRLEPHLIGRLIERLGPEFVADEEGLRDALRRGRAYQAYFLPLVVKIDFFPRGVTAFDRSELARRIRLAVGEHGSLYVATPEDNLLRKLMWFREGGEVSDRQWRDILGLLRTAPKGLDQKYLDQWAASLGVRDLLERAVLQAGV
jgi:hypothetical protein